MELRTPIDLACGMIMEQSHCTQEEAFKFLTTASRHRNQKVHDVADGIIKARTGSSGHITAHFQDRSCLAQRTHAAWAMRRSGPPTPKR
ncbi:ANTAR domain-containing protein [Arthrobacter sp. cf158]|nr:ANTAR domain-containing protein [Arthrobacter sp. cf158]